MNEKILLLGSSGFIGSAVYEQLKETHNIFTAGRCEGQDFFLDLNQSNYDTISNQTFDTLIHCAGVTDEEMKKSPESAWNRTVMKLPALIEQMKQGGLKRIIYISTAHVYGKLNGLIQEDKSVNPRNDYAMAHYLTEQIIRNSVCDSIILRPSTVYGVSKYFQSFSRYDLIPYAFANMAVRQQKITLLSTGMQKLNFVDIGQIAKRIAEIIDNAPRFEWGKCYNEAGLRHISVLEYAGLVKRCFEELTGKPCHIVTGDIIAGGEEFNYLSSLPSITELTVEEDINNTIGMMLQRSI